MLGASCCHICSFLIVERDIQFPLQLLHCEIDVVYLFLFQKKNNFFCFRKGSCASVVSSFRARWDFSANRSWVQDSKAHQSASQQRFGHFASFFSSLFVVRRVSRRPSERLWIVVSRSGVARGGDGPGPGRSKQTQQPRLVGLSARRAPSAEGKSQKRRLGKSQKRWKRKNCEGEEKWLCHQMNVSFFFFFFFFFLRRFWPFPFFFEAVRKSGRVAMSSSYTYWYRGNQNQPEEVTDRRKWRLRVDEGRQVWEYVNDRSEQSTCEK
jgi:hypothetical protein